MSTFEWVLRYFSGSVQIMPSRLDLPATTPPPNGYRIVFWMVPVWFVLSISAMIAVVWMISSGVSDLAVWMVLLPAMVLVTAPQWLVLYFRWKDRRAA